MPGRFRTRRLRYTAWLPFVLGLTLHSCSAGASSGRISVRLEFRSAEFPASGEVPLVVVAEDPDEIWSRLKIGAEFPDIDTLLTAFNTKIESAAVAKATLYAESAARIDGLAPGSYWVVSLQPVTVDGYRFFWSSPFSLGEGNRPLELVFQRSNASLVLNPGKHGFRGNQLWRAAR